ncbi:unnamed protein product [Cuscuta campestris]|uniref:Uncharacterized protein n=1 Tax=Cuscuta campestris TaxID=132261 RepID=A0A484MRH2_9ASTE|nr:unnamed protein product [Cuscuta campestris]
MCSMNCLSEIEGAGLQPCHLQALILSRIAHSNSLINFIGNEGYAPHEDNAYAGTTFAQALYVSALL